MHSRRRADDLGNPADDGAEEWAGLAARRLALIAADAGDGTSDRSTDWWADHTRVARPVLDAAPAPPVPPVPVPGRHAARRRPAMMPRLPGLGPAHVAIVAVLVALGLAVTTWLVVRDRPGPPRAAAPPVETVAPLAAGVGPTTADEEQPASATVTVDVAGRVRRPGIVVLDEGARVTDALEAAGGVRRGVDLTSLNLARVLVDGEQIVVGRRGAAGPPASGAPGAAPGSPGVPVNLNLAGQAELEALPQVGPVTAAAIIAWRDEHGGFTSVEELLEVDGIGPKTLEQLADHVTV